jgi:hypothetical protein
LTTARPWWVAQVNFLAEARARLVTLQRLSPGRYFIHDAETGKSMVAEVGEIPWENVEQA